MPRIGKHHIHPYSNPVPQVGYVTEGGAYQMLLCALIEAEREPPDEYLDVLGRMQ